MQEKNRLIKQEVFYLILLREKGIAMIKEIFSKFGRRKKKSKSSVLPGDSPPSVRDSEWDTNPRENPTQPSVVPLHSASMVTKKRDNVEVFNEAVEKLIDKLENINDNLSSQVQQNKELVERMNTLPELLTPLPKAVAEQRQAFAQVAEQLRQKVARDEKVAEELSGIHEKVTESVRADERMCETFGTFSETLSKLNSDTITQTEWLEHISRTFAASERYLKYAFAKQQARFYWIFGISMGICFLAVAGLLVGIVLFLQG